MGIRYINDLPTHTLNGVNIRMNSSNADVDFRSAHT